jgi:hypothetical protein
MARLAIDLRKLTKLTWSRPDSRIAPFCSNCLRHIPEDTVPLMMWDSKGACVQLCDECVPLFVRP